MKDKYRVRVDTDEMFCFGCDCTIYILEKRRKFLWLITWWEEIKEYPFDMEKEAYSQLEILNKKK